MSLSDELLARAHRFLRQNQYPSDPAFCRLIADNTEKLLRRGQLDASKLAAALRLPASYRRRQLKKAILAQQIVAEFESLSASLRDGLSEDIYEFMRELKYYIRRDKWRAIFRNGNPREAPGREAVRDALFGFFHKEGLVFQEVPSGRGRIDVLVARGVLQVVVETKLSQNYKGVTQLEDYIRDDPERRRGYFFVFDTTPDNRFRHLCSVENGSFSISKQVNVLVAHVNLSVPSRPKS